MSLDETEFNLDEQLEMSKQIVNDLLVNALLFDPKTNKPLFIVAPPSFNPEDGTVSLVCASEPNPKEYVVHTFVSFYADPSELAFTDGSEDQSAIISDPNSGKIVGLDGNPLN